MEYSTRTIPDDPGRVRRGQITFLLIAVPMLLLHIRGFFVEGNLNSLPTLFLGIPVALYFLWRGNIDWGGLLLLGFGAIDIFLHMSDVAGLGLPLGIIFAVGSLTLVSQLFVHEWRANIIWTIAGVSIGIVLFDLYWPYMRRAQTGFERFSLLGFAILVSIIALYFTFKNFTNYSLRTKFLVGVAFLAVAGIVANTYFISITNRAISLDNAGQILKNRVEEKAVLVGRELESHLDELLIVARDNSVIAPGSDSEEQLTPGDAAEFLNQIREVNPNWASLTVVDLSGQPVVTSPTESAANYASAAWFEAAASGNNFLGSPEELDTSGDYVIPLAVPITDDDGQLVGVLRGLYRLSALTQLGLGETAPGLVTDSPIFVHFSNGLALQNSGDTAFAPARLGFETLPALGSIDYEMRQFGVQPNLVAAAPVISTSEPHADVIGGGEIYVVSRIGQNLVISDYVTQQRGQILIGLLILLLALAAAIVVSNLISRPILALIDSAGRLATGNFSTRAPVIGRDEIATLARAFNQMADQVQFSVGELEMRVNERTAALSASSLVAQTLASSLNQEQIIGIIVQELKTKFNFYHVHIYLRDPNTDRLVVVGGSGQIGQQLRERGHALKIGHGLVGRAAATGETVLVEDVSKRADWLPNPLLPDTRSELAVPIALGDAVVGVLDVQDVEVGGFTKQDQEMMETIANQLAISLRNAQLFEAVQDQSTYQEKLIAINAQLREATSIKEVLEIASQEVATYLDIPAVTGEIKSIQGGDGGGRQIQAPQFTNGKKGR